jgi:indolepyruvate ferredoxin oxidoreductase
VGTAAADLILGCDPIVTAGSETLVRMREGRTHVALNSASTPTAAFVRNADWQNPAERCVADVARAVGEAGLGLFDADALASRMMGDTLYVNPMILGYAWQKGWIPLGREALLRAIELNAVAVDNNKAAFEWGRRAAQDPAAVEQLLAPQGSVQVIQFKKRETLDSLVARRVEFLTAYQSAAYAARYRAFVEQVRAAEAPLHKTQLAESVARYLFKLMAYKDEYEVARLHSDGAFLAKVQQMFEGDYKLAYHLAPPLLARKDENGLPLKRRYGPAMLTAFRLLARLKGLRGTPLDPFGRTEERRTERALIAEYQASIAELLPALTAGNHAQALEIARLPEQIRGFGHVKARHLAAARQKWDALMAAWRQPQAAQRAA